MKHILCVRLLNFPIDRWKRTSGWLRDKQTFVAKTSEESQTTQGSFSHNLSRMARSYCPLQKVSPQVWVKGPVRPSIVKNPLELCQPTSHRGGHFSGRQHDSNEPSIVLIRTVATQQIVIAVNASARNRQIKPGMTLAQARAIDADLLHDEHDPVRDAKAMEALARWMMRFSPVVSFPPLPPRERAGVRGTSAGVGKSTSKGKSTPHPNPLPQGEREQGIYLDITGCDRVFKGLKNLVAQLRKGMERLKISCAIAIAPSPGAAWALSYSRKHQDQIVGKDQLKEALSPLLPMTLRLSDQMVKMLQHLGLTTIGQLEALPRESLPARFGSLLLTRLDQAFDRIAEPLTPLEPFSPIEARRDFDGAVSALEPLWITLRELIDTIMRELLKRGRGARTVEAEFLRESTPPVHRTIKLSRPSRDGLNLFNLLRCTLENLNELVKTSRPLPFVREGERVGVRGERRTKKNYTDAHASPLTPALSPEGEGERHYIDRDGFVGIRLIVSLSEPLSDEQITLLGQEDYQGQIELDRWIERLSVRMGPECVIAPRLRESHLPERAFQLLHAASERSEDADHHSPQIGFTRPLLLLHHPRELRVMVSPSHDRDGKPIQFTDSGNLHRLVHAIGPERIGGQWWEGHEKTRDYFEVEDESGRRFWIFRVNESHRWFVQGEYS